MTVANEAKITLENFLAKRAALDVAGAAAMRKRLAELQSVHRPLQPANEAAAVMHEVLCHAELVAV
jgi:hypothetical protein